MSRLIINAGNQIVKKEEKRLENFSYLQAWEIRTDIHKCSIRRKVEYTRQERQWGPCEYTPFTWVYTRAEWIYRKGNYRHREFSNETGCCLSKTKNKKMGYEMEYIAFMQVIYASLTCLAGHRITQILRLLLMVTGQLSTQAKLAYLYLVVIGWLDQVSNLQLGFKVAVQMNCIASTGGLTNKYKSGKKISQIWNGFLWYF